MYMLKKGVPPFEIVEGPMAGRRFVPGQSYAEIPDQEKDRFEKVKSAKPAASKAKDKQEVNEDA